MGTGSAPRLSDADKVGLHVRGEAAADGASLDFDHVPAPEVAPEAGRRIGGRHEKLAELAIVNDQADVGLFIDVRDGASDADAVAARAFVLRQRADVLDGGEGGQRGVRRRLRGGPRPGTRLPMSASAILPTRP